MSDQNRTSGDAEAAAYPVETPVIEMGPPVGTPRPGGRVVTLTAVFAVGVAVGLVIDHRSGPAPAARVVPVAIASTPVHGEVVVGLETCSATNGARLDVGMEITSHATVTVMLTGATITLPQHGLRLHGTSWTHCGVGPALTGVAWLAPGASAWISANTEMTGCLGEPLITFTLSYLEQGQPRSLPAETFNDAVLPVHAGPRSTC